MFAKSYLYPLVLSFSLVFSSTSAFALIKDVDLFEGVECIGGGEQAFCVQEIPGQYQVTNYLNESVSAFGVTNLETSPVVVFRPEWDSFSITSETWDSGYVFTFYNAAVSTNDFGSFAELFGTDPVVNFYFLSLANTSQYILLQGETDANFFFNADIVSDVTAFGASANVLHTTVSSVSAVPEPSAYAMLLAGLGLLGFAKRRQG